MPFDFLAPFPLPSPLMGPGFAPPGADTAIPERRAVPCRLCTLPDEIVLRIAACLDDPALVRLSETCRRIHTALADDLLETIRLAGRIRWVVTPSAVADMVQRILQRPTSQRSRLALQLAERRSDIHPSLLPYAQKALSMLEPLDEAARLSQALHRERWRRRAFQHGPIATELPPLAAVLSLPVSERGRVLAPWIELAGKPGIRQRSLADWQAIATALPQAGRARVLTALATHMPTDDLRKWDHWLSGALEFACGCMPVSHPLRIDLLGAVARAIARFEPTAPEMAHGIRRGLWDKVLATVASLPVAQRRELLQELAAYPAFELSWTGNATAWQGLLDATAALLGDPDAIADVLAAMADDSHVQGWSAPGPRWAMLAQLIDAARRLPDPQCARVLAMVLHRPTSLMQRKDPRYEHAWNAIFVASAQTAAECQAPLLAKLAECLPHAIHHGRAGSGKADMSESSRWQALIERTMKLPVPLRLGPAKALARASNEMWTPAGRDADLLGVALSLPDAPRAKLLAAMLRGRECVRPRDWREIVNQIGNLPGTVRRTPARELICRLVTDHYFLLCVADDSEVPAPRQSDLALALWPRDLEHALQQASAVLQWLPLKDAGAALVSLLPDDACEWWRPQIMTWVLREVRRLPPDGRYDVTIVTGICAAMEALCRPEDMDAVLAFLPELWAAVLGLPCASRASALAWLADMASRLEIGQPWTGRLWDAQRALPEADRTASGKLKRKQLA